MSVKLDRKIELNEWLVSVKWCHWTVIFLASLLICFIRGRNIYDLSFFVLYIAFGFINLLLYFTLKRIKTNKSERSLLFFGIFQIIVEILFIFSMILIVNGGFLIDVFFFLPIISSAIILGSGGVLFSSFVSAVIIVYLNFFYYIGADGLSMTKSMTDTVIFFSVFVVIVLFIFRMIRFTINQDNELLVKAEKLERVSEYQEKGWKQSQKTAELLVEKEKEITIKNEELDKKIKDLERSEKSMFSVFSDLKRAREKAEREKNKTEAIISNFVDPIILINSNDEIGFFNPAAREIFGFADDCLNKKISKDGTYSMNNFKNFTKYEYITKTSKDLKLQDSTEEEVVIMHVGNELTFRVITVAVIDKYGDVLGTMKIFNNLTREKTLDKMKSDFISIAAHQLRTPLAAIKWVIKMVLDGDTGKLNEEQEEMLFRGYRSNERIIELVNDMLDVSRIEEGRFGYSFGDGDILQELDFVLDSLQGKIKDKSIKLIVNKPEVVPLLYMDRQKMTLVLQNLIENAVKYTPDRGKVEVSMEIEGGFLKTRIKDSGVGIPDEDQKKMFSKFFRASNVMRMQTEGSGLGLFIVKNIIKKHGGEISFKSKEGFGTEFVFSLPLKNK